MSNKKPCSALRCEEAFSIQPPCKHCGFAGFLGWTTWPVTPGCTCPYSGYVMSIDTIQPCQPADAPQNSPKN